MRLSSVRDLKAELLQPAQLPTVFAESLGFSTDGATALRVAVRRTVSIPFRVVDADAPAVALGITTGSSKRDFRLGARVVGTGPTAKKLAASIERKARGECDVRVVPRVAKRCSPNWLQSRLRPLEAGASIGHFAITAGTLGCIVEDDNHYYALSNNHVLANVNDADAGDPVLQPGPIDGGQGVDDLVGVLERFVPMSFKQANVVDAAIGRILPDLYMYAGWNEALQRVVSRTQPISYDELGMEVRKIGRTTGCTTGEITQVEIDQLSVDMGELGTPKLARFDDQFEVRGFEGPFSQGGDSGSLIVSSRGAAVGLLFAGGADQFGNDYTFANSIDTALSRLGVKLAS